MMPCCEYPAVYLACLCFYMTVGSGGSSDDEDDDDTYSAAKWKLAAHRSRMSAKEKSLLLPTQKLL